jgi:hypothetical protein
MTAPAQPITDTQRRQLEELYRQQISAVRTLARLLGYPCPIADRADRAERRTIVQDLDGCGTLKYDNEIV